MRPVHTLPYSVLMYFSFKPPHARETGCREKENAEQIMVGIIDQIRDLTRRDLLTPAAPLPGVASPAEPLPRAVRELLSGEASSPSGGGASQETEGLSPAPVPATAKRGAAIRNNRIDRPNVVTRRAAAELTGAVTRYRGVQPNNNSNNSIRAALVELFQPSTLHKLRHLGLYPNTDTPDAVHQLDVEVVAAEVACTMTNTQPSCSGGGESDRVLSTFKEAIDLLQAACWKTASDKEIASLEKHGVFKLIPIISVPVGHKVVGTRWMLKFKADSTYKGRLVVQGFWWILGMNVTPVHEKGAITISQKDYTDDVVQRLGKERCNPAYTPGVVPELSLNQPEEKVLNEVEKRRYQAITGAVYVFRTSHPLPYPLCGQSAGEGYAQARESPHEGGQAFASLLDQRVHRLFHHLQVGRLPVCCLLECQLGRQPR